MKRLLVMLLCLAIPTTALAADIGYNVIYIGGSLATIKPGRQIGLYIERDTIEFENDKDPTISIPINSVTEISYGEDAHRRVAEAIGLGLFTYGLGALLALTKSKKHYIGLTWANGTAKGGLAMQCDKNQYRGILTALEGVTGKKAVDSDPLAVKTP